MVIVKNFNVSGQYGLESTYGTGVAASTAIGRLLNIGITINNNPIKTRGLGAGRNVQSSLYGPLDVSFNWEQELHDPTILKLAVGAVSGAGTSGDPYVLTEASTVATTGVPFFTLEKGSNDSTDEDTTALGCVVDSFTINFAVDSVVRLSMSGPAQTTSSDTTAAAYTEVSTLPYVYHQITCKWGSTPSAIARVMSGSVTMNNNLVKYRSLGSRFIAQPEPGLRDYMFTLTVLMSESSYQTLRTSFYGASGGPVTGVSSAAFVTTDEMKLEFSEGSSTGNRNFHVWLDECVIDTMSEAAQVGNGLVQVTFSGHAHKGKDSQPIRWYTA